MTATLAALPLRGRPSRQHLAALDDEARTAREDLVEHCREAVAFVDGCVPLIDAIERLAVEFDPRLMAIVRQLSRRHHQYQARHLPSPDEPEELAA